MRKFLIEMETVITLEHLARDYENRRAELSRDGIETFPQYLEQCMARNNGALTEIMTDDTPRGNRREAVRLCNVWYSEDARDVCAEWLTPQEIARKTRGDGLRVDIIEDA